MEIITIDSSNVEAMRPKINNKQCFIKFWMDGCGHCVQMAPEWERMKREISKEYTSPGGTVAILDIDAPASSKIHAGRQVKGFPTIMHTLKGKVVGTYDGPRTADEMKSWIVASARDLVRSHDKHNKERKSGKRKRAAKRTRRRRARSRRARARSRKAS
jgi:thioredoxin-like negative regulator of GroEL